jgi:hypothetical protein
VLVCNRKLYTYARIRQFQYRIHKSIIFHITIVVHFSTNKVFQPLQPIGIIRGWLGLLPVFLLLFLVLPRQCLISFMETSNSRFFPHTHKTVLVSLMCCCPGTFLSFSLSNRTLGHITKLFGNPVPKPEDVAKQKIITMSFLFIKLIFSEVIGR